MCGDISPHKLKRSVLLFNCVNYNGLPEAVSRSALMERLNALACLDAAAFLGLRVLILCLAPPRARNEYLKRDLLWWLLAALGMAAAFFFFAARLKTGG